MTKEIIVNAGEMESRVAVLENGRLMELHIERDPKIVGNIYKGRVSKVLKGMDAAFVDIGIEQNAFLSVSDVVSQDEDDDGGGGGGRFHRHDLPPITQLLHAGQEILAQVVRAPMGTKGARITTRLSLPGRYMVLMLHSGSHVGVSRKVEDPKERQRLRAIASSIKPENYSLIVRTEAEGKSDEELRQDLTFLLDMARRLEEKADHSSAPALVHGDLNLILRLIRDAFTRDVNRLVVDSPSAYENILELVGMISPGLKNRVFLYDEPTPIFHTYNVENEIERTLRRKVWLPSGGHLAIDQAEALIAIDVNTGRFVGTVELSETVLTTNLQAAEEVARQLRLRDLGGIIVVDFIDMDNPKHRNQVMHAFEEALKRDRAKIKVHNISALGLVEMTRKRTGESLAGLLTEPCPYCSGIGRIQNTLTMALRIQREIAATAVEYPDTEAFSVTAHPRVIASVLGYEGEIQRDLEAYIEHPVYLRNAEDYHPNTYLVERLTMEQVLAAVPHLEEGDIVEGRVVNPDPALSLSPLVMAKGIYVVVPDLDAPVGAMVKVKITGAGTSLVFAQPLAEELRGVRVEKRAHAHERPPLLPETILPAYLREERAARPPRELSLLSPTASSRLGFDEEMEQLIERTEANLAERAQQKRRRGGRRREKELPPAIPELPVLPVPEAIIFAAPAEIEPGETTELLEAALDSVLPVSSEEQTETVARRRRRRRRRRGGRAEAELNIQQELGVPPEGEEAAEYTEAAEEMIHLLPEVEAPEDGGLAAESALEEPAVPRSRRRSRRSRRKTTADTPQQAEMPALPELEPIHEIITPEQAAEALASLLNALPKGEEESIIQRGPGRPDAASLEMIARMENPADVVETPAEAAVVEPIETPAAPETPQRRARRPRRGKAPVEETPAFPEEAAPEALPLAEEPAALLLEEIPMEVPPIAEAIAEEPAPPARRRRPSRRKPTEEPKEE